MEESKAKTKIRKTQKHSLASSTLTAAEKMGVGKMLACLSEMSLLPMDYCHFGKPNHDLRGQKKTDDKTLLSMGKHMPVATHINRSLTKARHRMSEEMA